MRIARRTAPAALLAVLLVLSGCSLAAEPRVTRLPTDGAGGAPGRTAPASPATEPSPHASALEPGDIADCSGRSLTIMAGAPAFTLVGDDCAEVRVQGNDLAVDAGGASVAILELSGDRITLSVGRAGALVVAGNDVVIDAGDVSQLTIRGDRNEITANSITGVSLQGNDNVVRGAGSLIDDQGARNLVE